MSGATTCTSSTSETTALNGSDRRWRGWSPDSRPDEACDRGGARIAGGEPPAIALQDTCSTWLPWFEEEGERADPDSNRAVEASGQTVDRPRRGVRRCRSFLRAWPQNVNALPLGPGAHRARERIEQAGGPSAVIGERR